MGRVNIVVAAVVDTVGVDIVAVVEETVVVGLSLEKKDDCHLLERVETGTRLHFEVAFVLPWVEPFVAVAFAALLAVPFVPVP